MAQVRQATASRPELLEHGSDARFRSLIHDMLAFSGHIEAIRNGFGEEIGLSGPQYTILIAVAHLEGGSGIGINALASHVHLSSAFVTTEVNKLVTTRLMTKRPNPDDRRRVLLTVAPAGWKRLDALAPHQRQINDALFGALGRNDFLALSRIMAELVPCAQRAAALQEFLGHPEPRAEKRSRAMGNH